VGLRRIHPDLNAMDCAGTLQKPEPKAEPTKSVIATKTTQREGNWRPLAAKEARGSGAMPARR